MLRVLGRVRGNRVYLAILSDDRERLAVIVHGPYFPSDHIFDSLDSGAQEHTGYKRCSILNHTAHRRVAGTSHWRRSNRLVVGRTDVSDSRKLCGRD